MNVMFNVCKRMILRGNLPEDFAARLVAFRDAAIISEEEYNKLVEMM